MHKQITTSDTIVIVIVNIAVAAAYSLYATRKQRRADREFETEIEQQTPNQ